MAYIGDVSLQDVVSRLQNEGVFTLVLPFLLVFAIIFGILSTIGLFGKESRATKVNAIIAGIIGAYAILFSPLPYFIANMTASSAIVLVGLLFLMMIISFVLGPFGGFGTALEKAKYYIAIIGLIIGSYIFWINGGFGIMGIYFNMQNTVVSLFIVAIALILFYYLYRAMFVQPKTNESILYEDLQRHGYQHFGGPAQFEEALKRARQEDWEKHRH